VRSDYGLIAFRAEVRLGFVFICLDPSATGLDDYIGDFAKVHAPWPHVEILVRGNGHYGSEPVMAELESLEPVAAADADPGAAEEPPVSAAHNPELTCARLVPPEPCRHSHSSRVGVRNRARPFRGNAVVGSEFGEDRDYATTTPASKP